MVEALELLSLTQRLTLWRPLEHLIDAQMGGTVKNVLSCSLLAALALLVANGQAFANPCPPGNPPTNCAPPTGAIDDLSGTTIPHSYTQFTTSFVAINTTTNLSFAFRDDPEFLFLDDVSVTTGGGSNLVLNPGFELGPVGSSAPTDWTYLNSFGATFGGQVESGNGNGGGNGYVDGAVQAYDGITQSIATAVGSLYNVTFFLSENSGDSTFSRVSTNGDVIGTGGNGIDLLVYAGAVPTLTPVPEPATLTMFGLGLAAMYRRRRGQKTV
jgi:hypothetical protein